MSFNCNNVYSKPRQCYVVCTVPFLLSITMEEYLKYNHKVSSLLCSIFYICLRGNSSHFFISTYHLIILLPLCCCLKSIVVFFSFQMLLNVLKYTTATPRNGYKFSEISLYEKLNATVSRREVCYPKQ